MRYSKPEKNIANAIRAYAKDWTWFERIWLVAFTVINIYLFFAWQDTIIGLIASLSGMLTVVLVAKGKISNYYWGILNIVAYAYVAWQSKYYGEVMLNLLYYFPMQFIGLYYWKKHKNKGDDVLVKRLSMRENIIWGSITLVGAFGYGLFLQYLGGTLPFVDSASTVLSVIAMILMVKRVTEQWLLWIAVDVISVFMWFYILWQGGNDISMLVMWTAFLVNAIYGYINWRRMEHAHRIVLRQVRTTA